MTSSPSDPSSPPNSVPCGTAPGTVTGDRRRRMSRGVNVTAPATAQAPAGSETAAAARPNSPSTGQAAIAAAMSEDRGPDSLEANMRRLMKDLGLWGYHPRRSERSEKGWPDWAIVGSRIIFRELKTERGKVTPEQHDVGRRILAAGGDWDIWRPSDLLSGRIAQELSAISAIAHPVLKRARRPRILLPEGPGGAA